MGFRLTRKQTACLSGVVAAASMALTLAVAAQEAPPLPPPRPDRPVPPPPGAPADRNAPTGEVPTTEKAPEADTACIERLTRLGLRFEARPAVQEGVCSVQTPVLLSGLPDGVAVAPAALMTCPLAESLARWMGEAVRPEADRHFGSAPKKLLIGTSYQCRDQRSGAKLSEHAFGNGVDVMGFEFAKRPPLVVGAHAEGSPEAAFQLAVQKAACPVFTTVLGPGSDDAHGNHLHLDMRARKGDYRICQ
ncbi:MAG TPA: extensin family protein [Microvirga sp.]|nr:extensin family protein [Microvirga sp.]